LGQSVPHGASADTAGEHTPGFGLEEGVGVGPGPGVGVDVGSGDGVGPGEDDGDGVGTGPGVQSLSLVEAARVSAFQRISNAFPSGALTFQLSVVPPAPDGPKVVLVPSALTAWM